jgi:hypothetical protein
MDSLVFTILGRNAVTFGHIRIIGFTFRSAGCALNMIYKHALRKASVFVSAQTPAASSISPPDPNAAPSARPALSVARLAAPLNVRVFADCPSLGGLCRMSCKCPARQRAGSVPDSAIIIVSYIFADSPG